MCYSLNPDDVMSHLQFWKCRPYILCSLPGTSWLSLAHNQIPFPPPCCGSHLHNPYWERPWDMLFPRPSLGNTAKSQPTKTKCLLCPMYKAKKLRLACLRPWVKSMSETRLSFPRVRQEHKEKHFFRLGLALIAYLLSFLTHHSELVVT